MKDNTQEEHKLIGLVQESRYDHSVYKIKKHLFDPLLAAVIIAFNSLVAAIIYAINAQYGSVLLWLGIIVCLAIFGRTYLKNCMVLEHVYRKWDAGRIFSNGKTANILADDAGLDEEDNPGEIKYFDIKQFKNFSDRIVDNEEFKSLFGRELEVA